MAQSTENSEEIRPRRGGTTCAQNQAAKFNPRLQVSGVTTTGPQQAKSRKGNYEADHAAIESQDATKLNKLLRPAIAGNRVAGS